MLVDRREREMGAELSQVVWDAVFAYLDDQPELTGEDAGKVAGLLSRAAPQWLAHVLTQARFAAARS